MPLLESSSPATASHCITIDGFKADKQKEPLATAFAIDGSPSKSRMKPPTEISRYDLPGPREVYIEDILLQVAECIFDAHEIAQNAGVSILRTLDRGERRRMGSLSVVLDGKYGRLDAVIRHSREVATQHRFVDLVCVAAV